MINRDFMIAKTMIKPTRAEKKCKTPCKKMTNTVSLVSHSLFKPNFARLDFRLKKTAKVID